MGKWKETEIGKIPYEWEVKTFGEVCLIRRGASPRPIHDFISSSGIPWVKIADATAQDSPYIEWTNEFIIEEGRPNTVIVEPGDLIVSNSATPGIPKFMKIKAAIHDGWLLIEPSEKINKWFLYYLFLAARPRLVGIASGTVFRNLKTDIVRSYKIAVPSLQEQEAIAKILFDLDTKIELNNQINTKLDNISKALFKHWFIDFEFPDQNDKPYKSSGGKLIYNTDSGKKIPEGWEIQPIGKLAEFIRGFSYNGSEKSKEGGNFIFITLNNVKEGGGFKPTYAWLSSNRLKERDFLNEYDLIITNTEQTKDGTLLAFPAIVHFPVNYKEKKAVFSHHITRILPNEEESKFFLYYFLLVTQNESIGFHTGSVIWGLDVANFIVHRKIAVPPKHLRSKFNLIIQNLFINMALNQKENTVLLASRNALLQKLMSGKIRVPVGVSK